MKTIYEILVIVLLSSISACTKTTKENIKASPASLPVEIKTNENIGIEMVDTKETDSMTFLSVRGYIDVPPENRASISPFYGGFVKEIKVLPGSQVNKGDVLFRLQNPEYIDIQQQYLEAKEQLDYLQEDYQRQQSLAMENISSKKNYKKAASDYKVMLARANGLKEQLKLMGLSISAVESGKIFNTINIYAPIKGNVTAVHIRKGVYLDSKDVALDLISTDHIHLELSLFEKDALKIKKGQSIKFSVPEVGNESYEGEVYLVVEAIDMQKRTFLVHGHIDNTIKGNFLPGMYVEAQIKLE